MKKKKITDHMCATFCGYFLGLCSFSLIRTQKIMQKLIIIIIIIIIINKKKIAKNV